MTIETIEMRQYIQKNLVTKPEHETAFKVGDVVNWTNDYGIKWQHKIIGFGYKNEFGIKYEKFIYLNTESFWFPYSDNQLAIAN